jgi:hypothetical protein
VHVRSRQSLAADPPVAAFHFLDHAPSRRGPELPGRRPLIRSGKLPRQMSAAPPPASPPFFGRRQVDQRQSVAHSANRRPSAAQAAGHSVPFRNMR